MSRTARNTPAVDNPYPYRSSWSGTPPLRSNELFDEKIVQEFLERQAWGMEAQIDLFRCNSTLIRDETVIRDFSAALCSYIEMRRYKDAIVERFGDEPRVSGITLLQLIETSNISAHFIDVPNAGCINVFSCKAFAPHLAASFCQRWFEAQAVRLTVSFRGPDNLEDVDEQRRV